MRIETKFVIDWLRRHSEFIEALSFLSKNEKIHYIKKNIDISEDTDIDIGLTQIQCNLFYAAISRIEWAIVLKDIEVRK